MKRTMLLVALWNLTSFAPAFADTGPGHFYLGAGLGKSSVDGRSRTASIIGVLPGVLSSVPINGLPFHDHDTAWSVFAGYEATRYVGVELGFWDHGTFENAQLPGAKLGIREAYFGATLKYPFAQRLALTGSAGISRARFNVDGTVGVVIVTPSFPTVPSTPVLIGGPGGIQIPGVIQNVPLATPDDETGGYWRLGLSWRVTNSLEAGLSYGRRDLKVQEVKSLGLSVLFAF